MRVWTRVALSMMAGWKGGMCAWADGCRVHGVRAGRDGVWGNGCRRGMESGRGGGLCSWACGVSGVWCTCQVFGARVGCVVQVGWQGFRHMA